MAKAGVYHRDLTLDNIFLANDPNQQPITPEQLQDKQYWHKLQNQITLKVGDFGTAVFDEFEQSDWIRGNIRYYPPEAIRDKELYTEKSDVFMFGIAVWEIIHGKKFIDGMTQEEQLERTVNGWRPEILVKGTYAEIIERCWAQDPNERPTFVELADLL